MKLALLGKLFKNLAIILFKILGQTIQRYSSILKDKTNDTIVANVDNLAKTDNNWVKNNLKFEQKQQKSVMLTKLSTSITAKKRN